MNVFTAFVVGLLVGWLIEWAMDRAHGPKFQPGYWFGDDSDAARLRCSRAASALSH